MRCPSGVVGMTSDRPGEKWGMKMTQSLKKSLLCCITISSLAACMETESYQSASNGAVQATSQEATVQQNFTPKGEEIGSRQMSGIEPQATSGTACFQLNNGGATFFINASINLNAYPYAILGGSISGNICDSPNWALTSGSVGSSLTINGSHTGALACAPTISIVGSFGPVASYPGTYGFNGANNSFTTRTLFLGFNRPCP